jgi:hypothetical protein
MTSSHTPDSDTFYCCDSSIQAGEQLFGTAPVADVWLLLEYGDAWTRKAVQDNTLPPAVREALQAPIVGHTVRPLLIRQPGQHSAGLTFIVAVVDEVTPRLYRFELPDYTALLALDIPAIVAGDAAYAAARQPEPVYLVCANGRRDRACARFGMPVYSEFVTQAGEAAWQSTHLGGHRFAATALVLPAGIAYGHLMPGDVAGLVADHAAGRLDQAHLRGRTSYAKPVQAAEYFLREQTGEQAVTAYRLQAVTDHGDDRWTVMFAAADGGIHTVTLTSAQSQIEVYLSSADEAPQLVPQFDLLAYHAAPPSEG